MRREWRWLAAGALVAAALAFAAREDVAHACIYGVNCTEIAEVPPPAPSQAQETIKRFESIEAIKEFAGQDYEACVVPPKARELLSRFDDRSQHYEIRIAESEAEA